MRISIEKFEFNGFQENTYVVHDGEVCVVIDPGCYDRSEQEQLFTFIQNQNLRVQAVLLTHAHIDHVLGCHAVLEKYQVDLMMHEEEVETLKAVPNYASLYGFPGYTPPGYPTKLLKDGDVLRFGKLELRVLFTPGHSVGHVVFYLPAISSVINGDVLFAGSFGRTDLPGGNLEVLKRSIKSVLFTLPDDTIVYCGHGPETSIGAEKVSNYILQF